MLKGIKISKIAFIISFFSLFFFGLVTNVEAYCYCSGSSKVCYSGCEAYTNIRTCTTGCPGGLYCYDTNGTSLGVYCCDYKTTTNCSCGCSGGSCNTCCTPSTSCSCSPLSDTETSYGSKTVECDDGCGGTASSTCWCTGNCTPDLCPTGTSESGTHGTYATYTCTNACSESNSRTCKCTSACTPTSCPTGTTETDTGDYYDTYSCTNDCSESQSRNCYCSICTPPTCRDSGYSDTNLGYGQVPNNLTSSCRNGYNAPDYISKCDMTYRTCYCSSCLKQCPSPLTNTGSASLILNDFRECTNDCSVKPPENQDDCYEVESPQPSESLEILNTGATNYYGFNSGTHTGDRLEETALLGTLNDPFNPPIKMKATYTDTDGADDIEGMFVWFRGEQYTGELGTPILLSNTANPRAPANDSWGFMLRRIGSVWQPYVPSYNEGNVFWTKKDTSGEVFSIDGRNGEKMVEVTILDITEEDNTTVSVEFSLRFSNNNGNLFSENLSQGLYKIYLMGLDKFSFTPYDNYDIEYETFWSEGFKYYGEDDLSPFWKPNQLRYKPEQNQLYARDWFDTGKTWTIDRNAPTLSTDVTVLKNSITLSWDASDDRNLYAIVGNISSIGGIDITSLSSSGSNVSLHNTPFTPGSIRYDDIGKLNTLTTDTTLFQVNPNINGREHSGSVTLNINHEAQNPLDFYITVFDDAGNIVQSNQIRQDLNDWMVTSGGLAYSAGGTSFTAKELATGAWNNVLPPSSYGNNPGLTPPNVNLTSEMWGERNGLIYFKPNSPLHSYSIKFTGIDLKEEGYYTLLLDLYEKNKKNLGDMVREKTISGSMAGAVTSPLYCPEPDKEYCVLKSTADVLITSDFACNKKTLMFINGNLGIDPPLKNSTDTDKLSSKNGCIIVVKGYVIITDGLDASNNASFKYDKVNGYILADGQIIIKDEPAKRVPNTDPIIDGVYINGGLQSSKNDDKSIVFNRYLRLEDRLKFPLLAIDLHPKYGILAEKFFGSKYIIQTVELGVKP